MNILDKVVINEQDERFLRDLLESKLDGELTIKLPFNETFELYIETLEVRAIISQQDPETLKFTLHIKDDSEIERFLCVYNIDDHMQIVDFELAGNLQNDEFERHVKMMAGDVTTLLFLFAHVLNEYKEYEIIEVKEVTSQRIKKSKSKSSKRSKNKVVRVVHKVMRLNNDENARTRFKKARQWRVDEFSRRGHYRTKKDGSRTWVRATTVKTGANIGVKEDKTYRL